MYVKRICPNEWECGDNCLHYKTGCTKNNPYIATALEKAASISEKIIDQEAVKSIEAIKERRGYPPYQNIDRFYEYKRKGEIYGPNIEADSKKDRKRTVLVSTENEDDKRTA